jgi:hypothetical protein
VNKDRSAPSQGRKALHALRSLKAASASTMDNGSFEDVLAQLREGGEGERGDGDDVVQPDGTLVGVVNNDNNGGAPLPVAAEEADAAPRITNSSKQAPKPPLVLSLTSMAVTNDMAQVFGEALLNSQHDVSDIKLQVYWMPPSRTAYRSLLQYLRTSPCLTTISLYGNPTGVPGCKDTAEQILAAVAANPNVKEINLAWIELSAPSLINQRHIKELILIRSTIVRDDGEGDAAESTTTTTTTTTSPLPITDAKPSSLKTLIMDVWDDASKETLLAIGAAHTKVETLYVRFPLPFVQAQPVVDFISNQVHLKEVLVRNMGTDLSHMTTLVEALPDATTTVEVVHGFWESPAMQNMAASTNVTTCSYKTKMIDAMYRTNSLIMLHCYATTTTTTTATTLTTDSSEAAAESRVTAAATTPPPSGAAEPVPPPPQQQRESMFSMIEQEKIKEIGSRNYMLPVLMKSANPLWNETENWPALLSLGVSSEHPMHFSLVYELVRDQLVQRPALGRPGRPRASTRSVGASITTTATTTSNRYHHDGQDNEDNAFTTVTALQTPYQRFLDWVGRRRRVRATAASTAAVGGPNHRVSSLLATTNGST